MRWTNCAVLCGLALPALAPAFTPEATIRFNQWVKENGGWAGNYNGGSFNGFPSVSADDTGLIGENAANASASFVAGSIVAYGGYTVLAGGVPQFLGEANASLTDQVTFSGFAGTTQVTLGVFGSFGLSGNAEAAESVDDELLVNSSEVAFQSIATGDVYNGFTGGQTLSAWTDNLTYTFDVTPGTYTLEVEGAANVGPAAGGKNPGAEGEATFDPNWYLQVQPGVSYASASGYQLPTGPLSTPDPAPLPALAIGVSLFARRKRRLRPPTPPLPSGA